MPEHSERLSGRSVRSRIGSLLIASQMLVGIGALLASFLFREAIWSAAVREIGVALAAVAIVMTADRFLLYRNYESVIRSQINCFGELPEPGIRHIYIGGEDVRRRVLQVIDDSIRELLIQGTSLYSFFSDPAVNAVVISALQRSVSIRILLLDPDSEQAWFRSRLKDESNSFGADISDDSVRRNALPQADTRSTLRLLSALGTRYGKNLDVRLYSSTPEAFVLVTERSVIFQPYLLGRGEATTSALPTFEIANFEDSDVGRSPYRLYREHVEHLYLMSRPVSLSGEESGIEGRGHWDVFLCHSFRDKQAVSQIAHELEQQGISSFVYDQQIRPGLPFESAISDVLHQVDSVIVFVGPEGTSPWQDAELRTLLTDAVQQRRIVIPAFLPGVDVEQARLTLPVFLRDFSSVQFSRVADPQAIESLVWAITGKRAVASEG